MMFEQNASPGGATELEECVLRQILCRPSGACVRRTREPTANAMGYVPTALRASGVRLSC